IGRRGRRRDGGQDGGGSGGDVGGDRCTCRGRTGQGGSGRGFAHRRGHHHFRRQHGHRTGGRGGQGGGHGRGEIRAGARRGRGRCRLAAALRVLGILQGAMHRVLVVVAGRDDLHAFLDAAVGQDDRIRPVLGADHPQGGAHVGGDETLDLHVRGRGWWSVTVIGNRSLS